MVGAGTPVRLAGREVIREYSRQVMASPLRLEDDEVTELHQTQDPEVVIAEMRAKATMTTTGRPLTATSIQILRIPPYPAPPAPHPSVRRQCSPARGWP